MELFILTTNVKNSDGLKFLSPILNKHPMVNRWSIDLEDRDRVLRIEATREAKEIDMIDLIVASGIKCASLPE